MSAPQSQAPLATPPHSPTEEAMRLALQAAQPTRPGHFDELRGSSSSAAGGSAPATLTPLWQAFLEATGTAGWLDCAHKHERVRHRVREDGATYNVYDDGGQPERAWPLELLPMLVSAQEWRHIETGVQQRAKLLNACLADVYGPGTLLAQGLLPPQLVLRHPQYLQAVHGLQPAGDVWLHLLAFDLIKGPSGQWCVAGQRTQAPSGLGYLLENRLVIAPQFPEAFKAMAVQRLAGSFRSLLQGLMRLSPQGERARVALLTPGPLNETYFEHSFLARYLGITLVEGPDLTVRDDQLFLKTLHGLERIDVLLRRVDDDFLDPLELRADSTLGVPGLLQALRCGGVVLANVPGVGWLESPGLHAFWPGVAQGLLGEPLQLPSTESWWCGEAAVWQRMQPQLAGQVVAPTFPGSGGLLASGPVTLEQLSPEQRQALHAQMQQDPAAFTLLARVQPSQTPVWTAGQLQPRGAVLRVYALSDGQGGWQVLPGGLTRIGRAGDLGTGGWLSMQQGSASADTWVLTDGPVDDTTLLPQALTDADLLGARRPVASRSAENLFWLGRYTERAENALRLMRCALDTLGAQQRGRLAPAVLQAVDTLCRQISLLPWEAPAAAHDPQAVSQALLRGARGAPGFYSLAYNLQAMQQCAQAMRDRLSTEQVQLLQGLQQRLAQALPPLDHAHSAAEQPAPPTSADALSALSRTATDLAAVTGMQTDRMTRDDAWRLLSVGRQIERLDFHCQVLAQAFDTGAVHDEDGFALVLALFDSTITYRAQFQSRREVLALLHLLVRDTDNPRSLAWVARTMRERFVKLARHQPTWAAQVAAQQPQPDQWPMAAWFASGQPPNTAALLAQLGEASAQARQLCVEIERGLFAHVHGSPQVVWQ
ncbi:MAG: circularly permuted type 2 ATP-grasp protein [Ideonella sp.]|nr:circularly permuted type 2 ATP-grasp protein [Ideonella sp.]